MIPTMMLFGLLFGRWWKTALVIAALGWPLLLMIDGSLDSDGPWLLASLLGMANTAVGVAVHQLILLLWRRTRKLSRKPKDGEQATIFGGRGRA